MESSTQQNRQQPNRNSKRRNEVENDSLSNFVFGKVQPQALPLEEAVLGALMLDREVLPNIIEILKVESFYKEAHQKIYQAIINLYNKSDAIDLLTVTERIAFEGNLEAVGGGYYLVELSNRVASAANVEYHARIIQQKYIQRQIISISTQNIREAYEDTTDALELLERAEVEILGIRDAQVGQEHKMPELAVRVLKDLEMRSSKTGLIGVPSGFRDLDAKTSGFQNSDLIIVAGRPGSGKTGWALSVALNAAVYQKKPIGFFSLEMSADQLFMRLVSMVAEVNSEKLKCGTLEDWEWEKVGRAIELLSNAPIHIDDTAALNIMDLRARARRMKQQFGIETVIVDYLQLMTGTREFGGNREQEIASISRGLKALAKQLNVPVIALAQLSRAVEIRGGSKRPQLSDLRESGAIENDADIIAFIYRAEYYKIYEDEKGRSLKGVAEFIISKHRNGGLCTIYMKFVEIYTLFLNSDFGDENFPENEPAQPWSPYKHKTEKQGSEGSNEGNALDNNVISRQARMNDEDIPF